MCNFFLDEFLVVKVCPSSSTEGVKSDVTIPSPMVGY